MLSFAPPRLAPRARPRITSQRTACPGGSGSAGRRKPRAADGRNARPASGRNTCKETGTLDAPPAFDTRRSNHQIFSAQPGTARHQGLHMCAFKCIMIHEFARTYVWRGQICVHRMRILNLKTGGVWFGFREK